MQNTVTEIEKFLYEEPELIEIDLLNEENVVKGLGSEPPPPEG